MKILLSTTGPFQLLHSAQHELVRSEGYTLVTKSQTWSEHVADGRVEVHGQFNDEATDAEWLDTYRESDNDFELALASFGDRFPLTTESAQSSEPVPIPPTTAQVDLNAGKKGRSGRPASAE